MKRKQDVQDGVRRQMRIVGNLRHDEGLRVWRNGARDMQSALAVNGQLRLEDAQKRFGKPHASIASAVR
ncbi:hypothetical protein MF271_01160 (plasmid) [Deinococcus sp. KNUC1210]|uniref:hypothetical protein n=1 Tax=Deinococcus sp. KNUC1210 TaxID=2917691 RepID=UPI001EF12EE8|nr:hypothetical protein [Deinococcus sp. KNUC1210]ULH13969.1 hypothetical protein MF271_01160 [Deinococcus sp. KNUC1210]